MDNILFSIFPNNNFIDLSIYQCGWERCLPSHSFGPAARNHYLFHYIVSGSGTLYADDSKGTTQTYQVTSGQGFMLFPGQITTYIADLKAPWEYVWIEFDGHIAKETIESAGLTRDTPIYRSHSIEFAKKMEDEILFITSHTSESPLHLIGHLYLFLDYLTRSIDSRKITKTDGMRAYYIKEAINFIEQNFSKDITIEDIANCCKLNRSYFGKIFNDTLGKSPQAFLINYRMSKAAELLNTSDLSINEIGIAVGYPNQLHFSRAFKKVYGVSPRTYRNDDSRHYYKK